MGLPNKPITRKEKYLAKIAGQSVGIPDKPKTREEQYLDEIARHGGGGGGTSDYTDLDNKPQINNVELTGNKSLHDLGIAGEDTIGTMTDAQWTSVQAILS